MSRPKLPEQDKRSVIISFKLTPPEAEQLKKQANDAGYSAISDYLRSLLTTTHNAIELTRAQPMFEQIAQQIGEAIAKSIKGKSAPI